MTHKYEKKCWSCGSKNMEKLDTYVKCKDCGATWNEVPQLAGPIIEPGNVLIIQCGEPKSMRAAHPTRNVQRRFARTRKSKGS